MLSSPAIVVFSHLHWDFVFQRPQHVLVRLAANRRVLYIEEPEYDRDAAPHWAISDPAPNVRVCRPHTPVDRGGFAEAQMPVLRSLVAELLRSEGISNYVVWYYTPMAFRLQRTLSPLAIIYDCMDDLSSFAHAPAGMAEQEAALMAAADVVFTGGHSLYRARLGRHPNLYCLPSSVDLDHFRRARVSEPDPLPDPADQAGLPHPRLGYYGVIDERMDLALLDQLARAHPEWQIVLIGPVAKIDPQDLPRHPNLHFLGMRAYTELPAYLAGWDACLLPFAQNASTRFISPTKTLEYMAAERMIVSTPIPDVAHSYGEIVYLAGSAPAFIAACEQALEASPQERQARIAKMRAVLARTSWNMTAHFMELLIDTAVDRRLAVPAAPMARTPWVAQPSFTSAP